MINNGLRAAKADASFATEAGAGCLHLKGFQVRRTSVCRVSALCVAGFYDPPTEVAGSSKGNSEVQWNLNLREQKPSLQFGYSLHEGISHRSKP